MGLINKWLSNNYTGEGSHTKIDYLTKNKEPKEDKPAPKPKRKLVW